MTRIAPLTLARPSARPPIYYPESDGEPMAESDLHRHVLIALLFALEEYYRTRAEVYIAGDLLIYYEEGNPNVSVAPDVFVVFGIPKGNREVYKLWEEGRAPAVVFEITSKSTRKRDLADKRMIYEELGVAEYFLFDPLDEYLSPKLQGFRRQGFFFAPLAPAHLPGEEWELTSRVLGLKMRTEGQNLRLLDLKTGAKLRTPAEEAAARQEAEARSQALEDENAYLKAELARLRGKLQ
ncbi:MAG: Uma2 family endonuclease [Anaerolineales bacterium]